MLNKELDAVPEAIEEEIRKVSIDYSRQVREIENELEDYKVKANQEIKEANTEDKVFIKVTCKILDAIESINVKVYI